MDAATAALIGWGLLLLTVVTIGIVAMWRGWSFSGEASTPGGGAFKWNLTPAVKASITEPLKASTANKGGSEEEVQSAEQKLATVKRVRRGRILWVDDQPDRNAEEMLMLTNAGQSILTATTTEKALELLSRSPFDAVITDLTRHGNARAGLEIIEAVKAGGLETPSAFVYAMDPGDRAAEAIRLGAAGVFTTPGPLLQGVLDVIES